MIGTCNGSGILRDRRPGDTGEVHDCPGCVACMRDDEDEPEIGPPIPCGCACGWRTERGVMRCDCDAGGDYPTPCVCGPRVGYGTCDQCGAPLLSVAELEQIAAWKREVDTMRLLR